MTTHDLTGFIRVMDRAASSPVILHVPHASRIIPAHLRPSFVISDAEIEDELDAMTDASTDLIADAAPGVSRIDHGLSRLVVDVERFPGDEEEMNRVGMGVLYTHGSRRQEVRRPSREDREALLHYFESYSATFADLVTRTLRQHGRAVIIDVHSYPTHPLPYELHAGERRPEICIGVDPFHTPKPLIEAVHGAFDGYEFGENEPFHGSYVPLRYYGADPRVASVMLEIRRDVYLTGTTPREATLANLGLRLGRLVEVAG